MQVLKIQPMNYNPRYRQTTFRGEGAQSVPTELPQKPVTPPPIVYTSDFIRGQGVQDVDFEDYKEMSENQKKILRKKYAAFDKKMLAEKEDLIDKKFAYLPLRNEATMDEFIKTAKIYTKYKDQPIFCLGRSPKWFLNAALWMKDGIDDYKFVAFSKNWFDEDKKEGVKRNIHNEPTPEEKNAYFKYLKRIKADPKSIVEHMNETGKKTVITDYIDTGKGMTSFLDILSELAEKQGVLEDFSKSFQIVKIGCTNARGDRLLHDEYISEPNVIMPERLQPYDIEPNVPWVSHRIKQEFYNLNESMFIEMLINQNTNECRSTYYPHECWTVYNPDRFKTGLITDTRKVKKMIKQLGSDHRRSMSSFSPIMKDIRNLMNFRILDALNSRGLLKAAHYTKR